MKWMPILSISPVAATVLVAAVGLLMSCRSASAHEIVPGAYVSVQDGHLFYRGQRLRLWGQVGDLPGATPEINEKALDRLQALGFNSIRYWRRVDYGAKFTKGDGSRLDLHLHLIAAMQRRDMFLWNPALTDGYVTPDDVTLVNDPATAEAWRAAIAAAPNQRYALRNLPVVWDPRLEAAAMRSITTVGQCVNPYTGRRLADEPNTAVNELTNEQWWFHRMMGGQWQRLPAFFQQSLLARWHAWLAAKYGDDAKLAQAWRFLLPGESLANRTVLLAPLRGDAVPVLLNDANPQAAAAVIGIKQTFGPGDFTEARGAAVIEFFMTIWLEHKQRLHDHVKRQGAAWASAPCIWDTGLGYEMQSQYLHQLSDAVAHATYLAGFHHDPTHKRFPWYSGLDEQPRLAWDNPWVEHGRVPGKPYLVYETGIHNPAKYRAEHPLRMVALAAIQDWDAIMWHSQHRLPATLQEDGNFNRTMDYSSSFNNHPQGFTYTFDEVLSSSMRAAAAVFLGGSLSSAPTPTIFRFGRRSLYNPRMTDFGAMGSRFYATTWRYGARVVIDPNRENDEVEGPVYRPAVFYPSPLKPTPEITIDWTKAAYQKLDSPSVASFVGFLADYGPSVQFDHGTTFTDVELNNPEGTPYPVGANERYVAITLATTDGQPFAQTSRVVLSAVSTSFNTGFRLDESKLRSEFVWTRNPGATLSTGKSPALVTRVGLRVHHPALVGMNYEIRDWNLKIIDRGMVGKEGFRLAATQPAFIVEFIRPSK